MVEKLNTLLQELQALTQAAREPGRVPPEKLRAEVKRITGALQETLANLSSNLPPGASPETAFMVDVFRSQIATIMEQHGLVLDKSEEETENLSQDLQQRKRSGTIRT
jgi:hypothetical protein